MLNECSNDRPTSAKRHQNKNKTKNDIKNVIGNHEYKVDAYFKSLLMNIEDNDDYLLMNKNIRANTFISEENKECKFKVNGD